MTAHPAKIGVSACLLGRTVRYDGRHARNRFICDELSRHVELVPLCPETEAGFPTPREPICLVRHPDGTRVVNAITRVDQTARLTAAAECRLATPEAGGCDGFILQSKSPSCGLSGVKLFRDEHHFERDGQGFFAAMLQRSYPEIPCVDPDDLLLPAPRAAFLDRVLIVAEFRHFEGELMAFHDTHRLTLMSHAPGRTAELFKLARNQDRDEYFHRLAIVLAAPPDVKKQANVLRHIQARLSKYLAPAINAELLKTICAYASGDTALPAALALLRHHAILNGDTTLLNDSYWRHLERPYC